MQAQWSRSQVTVVTVIALLLMTIVVLAGFSKPIEAEANSIKQAGSSEMLCFVDGTDVISSYMLVWGDPRIKKA